MRALCLAVLACGCVLEAPAEQAESAASAVTLPDAIDYSTMTVEAALERRYQLMLPRCRGTLEPEILAVAKKGLLIGKKQGLYKDVGLEDLLAHARQEANTLINALEKGTPPLSKLHAIGTNLWDLHMDPGNDLLGNISWSVWQTISNNYLRYGKDFDPTLMKFYREDLIKYGLTVPEANATKADISKAAFSYRARMKDMLGEAKAAELLDLELNGIKTAVSARPELHALVTAALIQDNYDDLGARSPRAIRSYFWLEYQKNLLPEQWLGTVWAADINVRGDYGKQIVLGNASNDRGMAFWYAITGDRAAITSMENAWSTDPAHLTRADYDTLKTKGFLTYASADPALFDEVRALLP